MKKTIVVVTDCSDIAYSEIRGIILSRVPEGVRNEIDLEPVVSVAPFSIENGNFALRLVADAYPEGTIFLLILNPLKERPERLIGRTAKKGFTFVGANTGAFEWFFAEYGISELYELNDPGFVAFGGKHVHAPALSAIASGQPLKELGKPFDQKKLRRVDTENRIVHIDNFGLMKITNRIENPAKGDRFEVTVGSATFEAKYDIRMMSNDTGEWVIYPGSSFGLIEIGMVRQNGASKIGAVVGQTVTIKKLPN